MQQASMLFLSVFCIFVAVLGLAQSQGNGYIQPRSEATIAIGGGFVAYLGVPEGFGKVENCTLIRNGERILISMQHNSTVFPNRNFSGAISSFSDSRCGIRAELLTNNSAGEWTLEAINSFDEKITDSIKIHVFEGPARQFNTTITLPIGRSKVECTRFSSTKSCKMYENYNLGSSDKCENYIYIRQATTVECRTTNWGTMEESVETIFIKIEDKVPYTKSIFEESAKRYNLTCTFSGVVGNCKAKMPNKKTEITIGNGLNNGRYSTYQNNDSCTIEIAKVLDEGEIGLWTIYDGQNATKTGCLFYVGDTKENIVKQELLKLNLTQQVSVKGDYAFQITCRAPFELDHCYMIDDSSNIYFPDKSFNRSRFIGECVFTDLRCSSGKWICGLSSNSSTEQLVQHFDISVKPRDGETLTGYVRSRIGHNAILFCKSPDEEPIKICALTNPNGHVYIVGPNVAIEDNRIEYYGSGLIQGECGIMINEIRSSDFGSWTCQMNLYTRTYVPKFYMYISESDDIGLIIAQNCFIILLGISAIALLIGGVIWYCKRKQYRDLRL